MTKKDLISGANKANAASLTNALMTKWSLSPAEYTFSVVHAKKLSLSMRQAIFSLFEKNMRECYERSEDGYDGMAKRNELFDALSRFILVKNTTGDLIAFCMFRFEEELTRQEVLEHVLYIYELQVDVLQQRKGLGRAMVQGCEALAQQLQMEKVMLAVFKWNTAAHDMYKSIGYTFDEITMTVELDGEDEDRITLSKRVL